MKKLLTYLLLLGIVLLYLVPIYFLVSLAGKESTDTSSMWLLPGYLSLKNFAAAWIKANLGRSILNNVIITFFSVLLILVVGSLASYPLARRENRKNKVVGTLLIACLIVPPLSILVPLYKFVVDIHGLNTFWAIILILVTFYLPLAIFLYTNFIRTIPLELEEAAILDGCSPIGVFTRILFPLLKPVTSSIIILCGIQIWNDYQFSVFFLQRSEVQTLSVRLSQFVSQYQNDIGLVSAGCLMGLLPLVVVYLFLQKYFIRGLAEGAVKG